MNQRVGAERLSVVKNAGGRQNVRLIPCLPSDSNCKVQVNPERESHTSGCQYSDGRSPGWKNGKKSKSPHFGPA